MKILILAFIIAGIIGYFVLNTPDKRSSGEKISDAIHELPNGVDKAARQLEDRTPAEKLEDAAGDAADDLKKTMNQ
jgi:hypothetical protein